MVRQRPHIGVPSLRRQFPGLPKNSTAAYLRRLKRLRNKRRKRLWRWLRWHLAGAVWAIDGTWFDQPVGANGRRALVVVDLHSKGTLCVESVPGERAASVVACLARLFALHGAPLVLKADNGSAFIAEPVERLCLESGITLMHSPIRRPRFNGTCEVSGRWAKHRATRAARDRGSPDRLSQADLDHAVTFTGTMPRIAPANRAHFQQVVREQLALLAAEWGIALHGRSRDHLYRSLRRVAVQRALQLCHILTIEGREFPQCLPASAA